MEQAFRDAFALMGRPLGPSDAVPAADIVAAEVALGCKVPEALHAFHRVAGNARDLLDHHDHFLLPSEWSLEDEKLVFLAENQAVVLYAVDTTEAVADPPVLMASNEEPFVWYQVCTRCCEFLEVMLLWEGAFGGAMPISGSAIVDESLRDALETHFRSRGEVNAMLAFSGPGLAICLAEWSDGWRVFVGATDEGALGRIRELGVELVCD